MILKSSIIWLYKLPREASRLAQGVFAGGPPVCIRSINADETDFLVALHLHSRQNHNKTALDSVDTSTSTSADEPDAVQEPSAKSLGKRKAISPSRSSDEQHTSLGKATGTPARPSKRRRSSQAPATPSLQLESQSQSYNLRPRGSASTSTSKLNPANSTTRSTPSTPTNLPSSKASSSRSGPSMPRRGRGAASGSGGSGSRPGNTSLRAKAAANAAIAAANAASSSGRSAHANAQNAGTASNTSGSQSSRRQHDEDLDEEALQGIMDAREEMAMQDADMDENESEDEDDDDDHDDDSMQLIGGASMDLHREDEDETSHIHTLSAGIPHYDDDDDEGDDIDEDDDLHGDEMLDDDFEAPLTFDADGNPIASHAQAAGGSSANAGAPSTRSNNTAGAGGTSSSGDDWGSGAASSMSAAARAALAAAAAADDDFGSFAASLRGYPSSFMGNMSNRLRGLLQNIRSKDSSVKMIALQELSEILSMSTEDTLAGYFSVDAFVKELLKCLQGSALAAALDLEGLDEDDEYAMAEAIAAAADAAGPGGESGSEEEMQLLACRCLANLIEAMPAAAGNIVANGAVPVLCEKLVNITVIDLAEQTISVSYYIE